MKTIIITNNPQIATDAEVAGVSRIMVDLESIGKKERQASRTTFISSHQVSDIAKVRDVLKSSELIVRINPIYDGTKQEIEQAVSGGADTIMLPMITDMEQLEQAADIISGRAKLMPLVETSYSMAHIAEIAEHPAVAEVYIGLNDLHLSLGLDFLFEPLALGLLDWMVKQINPSGKSFGFGGIATMGSGELPAEYILAEHIRLGSTCVILSSRFCKDIDIESAEGRVERIKSALTKMQEKETGFLARSGQQINLESKRTSEIIKKLAHKCSRSEKTKMKSRSLFPNIVSGLLLVAYSVLIVSGIKEFTIGSQEEALIGVNPLWLLENLHAHALRYIIVWPIVTIAQEVGMNINTLFSFYVLLIAYLTSLILGKSIKYLYPSLIKKSAWYRVFFLGMWLTVLLFMNGRLICEFFGISAILYAQLVFLSKYQTQQPKISNLIGLQALGLIFTSVSTGTFSVAFGVITMFLIGVAIKFYVKEKIILRNFIIANFIIANSVMLLVFLPFQTQFFLKNACFFSGEIASYQICKNLINPLKDKEIASTNTITVKKKKTLADTKSFSYADTMEVYANADGTLEKSLRHGPLDSILTIGIPPIIEKILFWIIFTFGFIVTLLSYFYRLHQSATISPFAPLFATIGLSTSIGLFGIKSTFMMLPALILLGIYYLGTRFFRPQSGIE